MKELLGLLPQLIIDGLGLGFVYALVALGFTMVYGILGFMNFAHSEIFMVGAFAGTETFIFLNNHGLFETLPPVLSLTIALVVSIVVAALVGTLVERFAYRPLRKVSKLICLITAVGVSFFLQDFVRLVEGLWKNAFYVSVPSPISGIVHITEKFSFSLTSLYVDVISIILMVGLTLFIKKHKYGKAMRAVAQDTDTASLMGINANFVISLTFIIGAGMGGAGGTLFAMQYTLISPYVGAVISIKALTAAVLGGIGSMPGAMLGGLLLGVVEVVSAAFLSTITKGQLSGAYKDVISFIILIAVLILKPSGLLGKPSKEKV